MHFRKMAMRLILAGVLGLIVGMFMDTTVATEYGNGRVYNMGLQARQQNILLLSGIVFLAGIILFATAKLKATKEDEQAEETAKEHARAARREAIDQATDMARESAGHAAGFMRQQFSKDFIRHPFAINDRPDRRLVTGLLVGLSLGLLGHLLMPWWLPAIVCVAYAFLRGESRARQRHLLILHTTAYGLPAIVGIWMMAIPAVVSAIWLYAIRNTRS